ncbi:MAG: YihY/virulence factor BrkB family protein [Candidatus Kapaibacteriales bacterium]
MNPNVLQKFKTYFKFIKEFLDQIDSHHIFLLSAGISFNVILYVIPLILVGIFFTNLIFGINNFNNIVADIILSFLPETENTYSIISTILKETDRIFSVSSIVGWIGIGSLLWLSSTLFSSLRQGLNIVFGAVTNRVFVVYKIKDIILTLALNIFILLLSWVFPLINLFKRTIASNLPPFLASIFSIVSTQFFWISIYFLFFFFVYKFLPNIKIQLKIVILSSILCTILAEISRYLFTYYILNIANFSKFYGAYGFLVSMVLWVYYLFFIILFSGELSIFIFRKFTSKV